MSDFAFQDDARSIALNYVPARQRTHVRALWMLDETLARVVQTTTEPMIGQMRLTWWHERLCAVDTGAVAAEPVLAACAASGLKGAALADLVEGWEVLLEPLPWDTSVIETHARMRGGVLFGLTAQLLSESRDVTAAGEGWAAMDLAAHCSDPTSAASALSFATERLAVSGDPKAKALRILTRLARGDSNRPFGVPRPRLTLFRAVFF